MSHNRASQHLSDPYAVLRRPVLTEKSHDMASAGGEEDPSQKRYTFEVHVKANKQQIKKAVEAAFGVQVETINTMIVKPRAKAFRGGGRKPGFTRMKKKAVIRLAKGSKQIELI
ncbi:MAG TPA: 50S ribosomal protein L23 [Planctomycetota bacterium]|nr:50S ribosomal protein L23 [Planctomycetota bacterium]